MPWDIPVLRSVRGTNYEGMIMATWYKPGAGTPRATKVKAGDILINTSTFKPAHCGVVVENFDVIHATNKGIKKDDIDMWGNEAEMFRAKPGLSKAETDAVIKIATQIMASAEYGLARAAFQSTFGSHSAGAGLMSRLEKYRQRLASQEHQGLVKNVYCSDLVIMTYQLACISGDRVDENNRLFIKLDGKHCWPSTLRSYLKADKANWEFLGEYVPRS
jgi:hypothetical protein